jgi:hypothetical protein
MLLNHYSSFASLLQVASRFNLRQEWLSLTNSNRRASDVTFAEFEAAFKSIQSEFVASPDMSPWRNMPGGRSSLRSLVGEVTNSCSGVRCLSDDAIEKAMVKAIREGKLVLWPGQQMVFERVIFARRCRAVACSMPPMSAPSAASQIKGEQPNVADSLEKKNKINKLVRRLGDAIALGEGGYESYNAGTDGPHGKVRHSFQKNDVGTVTGRTINEILMNESKSFSNPTRLFATGKYQTIIPTLAEAKKKIGLTGEEKYTAEMQERVFREFLIPHAGGKHILQKFIFDGEGTVADAQYAASKEWGAIAAPNGKKIKDGRISDGTLGYHEKNGQNKANQEATREFVDTLWEIYNIK